MKRGGGGRESRWKRKKEKHIKYKMSSAPGSGKMVIHGGQEPPGPRWPQRAGLQGETASICGKKGVFEDKQAAG